MRMNMTRVFLGGLLAGLIINISEFVLNTAILGTRMQARMTQMNLPPIGGSAVIVFVALGFLIGIAMIWLYAAIRPRYGARPMTAMIAGAAVWFFGYFYSSITAVAMGMWSARLTAAVLLWGLIEVLIAALAGGYVYQEESTSRPARV
jgi:hypothetical protein